MLTVFSRICKKFLSDSKEINSDLPVTQGKPFSGEKRFSPDPFPKFAAGLTIQQLENTFDCRVPFPAKSDRMKRSSRSFHAVTCIGLTAQNSSDKNSLILFPLFTVSTVLLIKGISFART